MFAHNEYEDSFDIVRGKYIYFSLAELKGLCHSYGINLYYNPSKLQIIGILSSFIEDQKALKEFYENLPKNHQDILRHIIRHKGSGITQEIQKKFIFNIQLSLIKGMPKYVWWLELFIGNDYMDDNIRELFLEMLNDMTICKKIDSHIVSDLKDINGIEIKKVTIENKPIAQKLTIQKIKDITESIHILYNLLKAKKIVATKQGALAVKSRNLLEQSMTLTPRETIQLLNLLINIHFVTSTQEKLPTVKLDTAIKRQDGDMIKILFEAFLQTEYQYEFRISPFPMTMKKGTNIVKFRKDIIKIISALDGNNWLNIEYIVEQVPSNEATLKLITNNHPYCYQANLAGSRHNSLKYLTTVARYFIKGFVSYLYQLGLCDIAHTKEVSYVFEDLPMIHKGHPKDFTNLEYFRLTDLGRYVFGFKQDYTQQNSYKLLLSSYSLDVTVENESNLSELFLVNIATKISSNKYKTDIKTFVQQINSHKEFLNIKEAFINKAQSVPQNWLDFFSLLERRIAALKSVTSSAILIKIPNDKAIIQLIATNQKLKQKIIKADNLHIVVLKEDIQAVKTILKEQGIII